MIQFAVIAPYLIGIGKDILEIPLVHRSIENYFDGTRTIWDGIVWRIFEKYARIKSPAAESAVAIKEELAVVQEKYEIVKAEVAKGVPVEDAIRENTGVDADVFADSGSFSTNG